MAFSSSSVASGCDFSFTGSLGSGPRWLEGGALTEHPPAPGCSPWPAPELLLPSLRAAPWRSRAASALPVTELRRAGGLQCGAPPPPRPPQPEADPGGDRKSASPQPEKGPQRQAGCSNLLTNGTTLARHQPHGVNHHGAGNMVLVG